MTVPTMPIPRALESLCGVAHPPDADVPEVPIRHVIAAIANAVGGQVAEYLAATPVNFGSLAALELKSAVANASAALDDLLDAVDVAWPPTDDDVGDMP